jgi:WD40 repeat protein
LSGHTSGIDSVSFDSSEVLVAAGAASGTIKLWDLEEAKSMLFISICQFLLTYAQHFYDSGFEKDSPY